MDDVYCSVCNSKLTEEEIKNNSVNFLGLECYVCNECIDDEDLKGDINPDIE